MAEVVDSVWSERGTSPGAIEAALRALLTERHRGELGAQPARALNLVCVVDRAWSGEIANRLRGVGRLHASRTVVCSVETGPPARTQLDARVSVTGPVGGDAPLVRETVVVSVGERHLEHLDTIVDPLVVTDVATVVWAPHGHPEALDALTTRFAGGPPIAQVVLVDSLDEPDPRAALERVGALARRAHVVDLSWLRGTPWRERVAAAFDPPARRPELRRLAGVTVRHRRDSGVAALLLAGWLAARLGWRPAALLRDGDALTGRLTSRHGDVRVRLEPDAEMAAPGLCAITLHGASGGSLELSRGIGGLRARRSDPTGAQRTWTVLGASRGEPGILGEGLRQALLRDPIFAEALGAARGMAA